MSQFDIDKARRETPGCEHVVHFNNAGAALMPQPVLDAVINHLQLEAMTGGYEAAEQAADKIEHVYDAAANLLGCERDEIAIIENATRAWDMAFYAIPFQDGDRILTSMAEYASNYVAFLQIARRFDVAVEVIPNDEHGQVSVDALRDMLDDRVKVVAITHVPTNGGLVNPAEEIGRLVADTPAYYLLDACQSVGQMPINVEAIQCDMLSTTSRKYLRGPRGAGVLYVRSEHIADLEPPLIDLHAAEWASHDCYHLRADARRFENWETNYAAKIGFGVAIDYALSWGLDAIQARVVMLADYLRGALHDLPGVTVHDLGQVQCGIVSFTLSGINPEAIKQHLATHHINVTVSSVGSTRLDMSARDLVDVVRASVHYYNTPDEIDHLCNTLRMFKSM
ncbi:MAG: aminotransferase class V-fold PLP-dependent enzyme [Chloroflexi bacterium]|nr:MAG: aminotransferase class V-fold PLP-dependent enzyme [Chloroflexota bacterium]